MFYVFYDLFVLMTSQRQPIGADCPWHIIAHAAPYLILQDREGREDPVLRCVLPPAIWCAVLCGIIGMVIAVPLAEVSKPPSTIN